MVSKAVFVTESDARRLRNLLEFEEVFRWRDRENVDNLDRKLAAANVVGPEEFPTDRVDMYSSVYVTDLSTRRETVYTLVLPGDADISENMISVLAPIGAALLGSRAGSVIKVDTPRGTRKLLIGRVLHPAELPQSA